MTTALRQNLSRQLMADFVATASKDPIFSTKEAVWFGKVTARQLQWWDERKILKPLIDGHDRRYTYRELLLVRMIADLRRKRFSLQQIRNMMPTMKKFEGEFFVVSTKAGRVPSRWCSTPEAVIDALKKANGLVALIHVPEIARLSTNATAVLNRTDASGNEQVQTQ